MIRLKKHLLFSGVGFLTLALALTAMLQAPKMVEAANPICDRVRISVSPSQTTYRPGQSVTIWITGVSPSDGEAWLHWIRASANTREGSNWTQLNLTWLGRLGGYAAPWQIPDLLPGLHPLYNKSDNQEFIIAFTLFRQGQFVCSGNPDPGVVPGHPELPDDAMCDNCYKVLVTRDQPSGPTTSLVDYWNMQPGYSFTYLGTRHDGPEDDSGRPVSGNFVTRMEYERPIKLCPDVSLIPQRWTKNNRWGYWGPCRPKRGDRTSSIWTEGNADLRFFLSDPRYSYTWQDNMTGAYADKIYEVVNGNYELGYLSDTLERTMIHTCRNHENYYYPPYLLSYAAVPNSEEDKFVRIDSLYSIFGNDLQSSICQTRTKTEDHNWYTRVRFLTNNDLKNEFSTMRGYFGCGKDVVVLTFFEGGSYSDGKPVLREDGYLMEDVGLVGIDYAMWDKDDEFSAQVYTNATFMKLGTSAYPHGRARADRGYIGGPLQITAISPGTSFPLIVPKGSCYTVGMHSTTPGGPMPYDGRMQHDMGGSTPTLWVKAIGGEPIWADNGVVMACLPNDFPSGEYKVRLRPYITRSPSGNETALSYTEMPWSTNYLWVVVP